MDHPVLGIRANLEVRDVPASIEFYRRVLALEPVATMGDPVTFAILAGGPATLVVCQEPSPAVSQIAACYVDVSDVDAILQRCQDAGAEVTAELTTHPWMMRDFVIRDLDGHQIAIGERMA